MDNRTGQLLPFEYGRCDREVKCQYSFNPYKTDYIKSIADQSNDTKWQRQEEFRKTPKQKGSESSISSSIPYSIMAKSRKGYENNHFIQFLIFKFGNDRTNKAIVDYHIGTSKHWQGATIFWQIDIEGIIRAGKILQYDSVTGKRSKNNVPPVFWVHSKLKLKNFVLSQCLFGSHLLSLEPYKPVGLVESEKTAVIASICFPKFIWLATGGKSNLNSKALQFLKGRKVIVFPDLGATKDWKNIITKLSLPFYISDQLEKNATEIEKQEGLDLADFLLMERDTFIKEWNLEDKALCIVNPTIESCTKNNLNELSAKSEFFRQIKQD
ncbi:MAG: DUF6371 domain-containing protein, partial [Saprospiraceae bacterium]|nr:DUF6371 domain-containing protein [Saprospiraceae bacterium]